MVFKWLVTPGSGRRKQMKVSDHQELKNSVYLHFAIHDSTYILYFRHFIRRTIACFTCMKLPQMSKDFVTYWLTLEVMPPPSVLYRRIFTTTTLMSVYMFCTSGPFHCLQNMRSMCTENNGFLRLQPLNPEEPPKRSLLCPVVVASFSSGRRTYEREK